MTEFTVWKWQYLQTLGTQEEKHWVDLGLSVQAEAQENDMVLLWNIVWTHAEKHERRKKIPMLPDFHYAEHRLGIVQLYIPQIGVGLKTSALVTMCLARIKVNI